jgi:hypothetical protein
MTAHATTTGHLPAAHATSWACTCGAAHVLDYGPSVTGEYALRLATERAATHRRIANLARDLEKR